MKVIIPKSNLNGICFAYISNILVSIQESVSPVKTPLLWLPQKVVELAVFIELAHVKKKLLIYV